MSQPIETKSVSRRRFLQFSGISGTGLLLGLYFPSSAKGGKIIKTTDIDASEIELCAWIRIDTSGNITLISHRAEMGQGVYHSLAQIIAEELEVDLNDVTIEFAPGNKEKYGNQVTGGSSTIRGSYQKLLSLSATAREMLIAAAAAKWKVPAADCKAENGHVIHQASGKKAHYSELVVDASKLTAPKDVVLKKRKDYKLIGKSLHRKDTPLKTNGTATFGIDKKIPGMMYAAVERNPRFHGKVKSFDDSAARKIPGVKNIFKVRFGVHDSYREGVAVVANSTWAAFQGKKALKIEWDDSGFEHISTDEIYSRQKKALQTSEGLSVRKQGNPDSIIAESRNKIDVIYETPYQAHHALEPLNCVAHYQKDLLEIWGPIQAPEWVQEFISKEMNLPKEKVIVKMTFLGGGFGRKAFTDYPHEAALISKEIGGPVQVVWTREDDATQGPFRPGISYRCEGVIENGEISAAKIRMAGQDIGAWRKENKEKPNWGITEGLIETYNKSIKNLSIADVPFDTPIPPIWWRSVYASTNGFAYESFIDELAVAAGKDPLQFRRHYLEDKRNQLLINTLEDVSGWKNRKKGSGYGVAITECFGSTVGQIVKVSKQPGGGVKIDKIWAVMDCGWYVNPDIIKAQVEGSIVMGLGAATMHQITFTDGMANEKNFYSYQMPRINNIPPIEVYIMENDEPAGGVGEPGLPPLAPALTNAIFDLTGKRIRKLPFRMDEV